MKRSIYERHYSNSLADIVKNVDETEKIFGNKRVKNTRRIKRKSQPRRHEIASNDNDSRFVCKICGEVSVNQRALDSHQRIHTKPFKCEFCKKCFEGAWRLRYHLKIHTNEKPFSCELCGKSFRYRYKLRNHIANHEAPYKCELCGMEFSLKATLKRHVLNRPKNLENHTCLTCGISFCRRINFNNHMVCHSNIRPYPCEICGADFKTKPALNMHKNCHSRKQIRCEICNESYIYKDYLDRHMQSEHGSKRKDGNNASTSSIISSTKSVKSAQSGINNASPSSIISSTKSVKSEVKFGNSQSGMNLLNVIKEGIIFKPIKLKKVE
ncbi:zinc finger and BTB domain-containing protein 41-like [Styela clava]